MAREKTINVGLIGCGKRALWYGAIFDDIDPNAYAALDPFAYHHMTYYQHVELQIPRATGFRLVKIYDRDPQAARRTADAFRSRPEVCATLDDVSKGVDLVFIANDSGDGSAHLDLAKPGLDKGIPTFIDRPFAAALKDAKAIVSLARRNGPPLFSCSHLRMLPQAARFKARFAEIGPVEAAAVQGGGPSPAHIADAIELALFLFGDGFGGRVESVRNPLDSPDFDASVQPQGGLAVMNALEEMVTTRKPPLPYTRLVEPVAVTEAGRKAHNKPQPTPLKDLP